MLNKLHATTCIFHLSVISSGSTNNLLHEKASALIWVYIISTCQEIFPYLPVPCTISQKHTRHLIANALAFKTEAGIYHGKQTIHEKKKKSWKVNFPSKTDYAAMFQPAVPGILLRERATEISTGTSNQQIWDTCMDLEVLQALSSGDNIIFKEDNATTFKSMKK